MQILWELAEEADGKLTRSKVCVLRTEDEARELSAKARNTKPPEKGMPMELLGRGGRREVEENIGDFTTDIYSVSSQMLVTIRIDAEVGGF